MKNKMINVGVIGVGWFGGLHARLYNQLSGSNLVGVCDTNMTRADEVAAQLGVKVYKNAEELLADDTIEAVSICTSDQTHLEPTLEACRAGKHILIEKPMATSVEECDLIISAAKEANIKLMVAHILRFNQRYANAFEKIQSGEIGEVKYFYARRNNPKHAAHRLGARCGFHTIVFHSSVHDIDIMNWFAGSDVEEVYAVSQAGILESEGLQTSDSVLSILKYKNGINAIMENSWIYPDSYPTLVDAVAEVTGSEGKIVLDFRNQGGISYGKNRIEFFENSYWPEYNGYLTGDLHQEIEYFLHVIKDDLEVPVTGEDGRKAVAVAEAIVKSLSSGGPEKVR
jgi:UDP-N-acetylglucosamine 3-dehydrogenase